MTFTVVLMPPLSPRSRRAAARDNYAKQYPHGFKRRRNALQREKQIIAQRRYNRQPHIVRATKYVRQVKAFIAGKKAPLVAPYIGCTREEFIAHLQSTTTAKRWRVVFHNSAQSFDLTNNDHCAHCFHYSNMYAVPFTHADASQSPSLPAPSQANSSREAPLAQV